jgi:hypothetical protein
MGRLRAAAGEVDLEAPVGSWLSGFAARIEPTTGVHDAIMARAVLLDDGAGTLAVVSCDLIGFTPQAVARMRERIAAATDGAIPAAHVLIACTHTHSAPSSLPFHGVLGYVDGAWFAAAMRRIVDLVAGLPARLAPARVAFASTTVTEVGYNRQDRSRPIDDRLRVIGVDADDGAAIATVVNYATHAVVLGPDNLLVSADYPGETARRVAGSRGGVGLFLQGACGDVDPVVYRDRGWGAGTFDDTRKMGTRLADAALAALAGASWSKNPGIGITHEILAVPIDPLPDDERLQALAAGFEADRRGARARSDGRRDELIAEAYLDWAADTREALPDYPEPPTITAELFVAAIGGARIIGAPFETYSGIALEIARALEPLTTVFVGYANGDLGYCPTRWAKDQGGYGPVVSCRWYPRLVSPIGYGADDLIVARATALAKG